jgi:SSS family solute:Na+ symporter
MKLEFIDICIIIAFFLVSLAIGIIVSKKSSANSSSFYLSGRNMPWWLLGVSMVATTFAADTPNLVAGLVRSDGVSGNWVWWAFLLTGMLTVFFYARLWRRSGITTDLEFYEMRYSGKSAAFLRGFRAIYLGVVFNIIIMATVCLAAIKIGHVMFGFSAATTLTYASLVTLAYSLLGGLKGVLITDFVQFIIAMVGSIWATWYILDLPEINGMANLITHPY